MKRCTKCQLEKPFDEFRKRTLGKDGLTTWCKACFKAYERDRWDNLPGEKDRIYRNKAIATERGRDWIWEYLATHPCVDCGESDRVVLQFDHLDNKQYNVVDLFKNSTATIAIEVAKCEVRCANCHQRKTAEQFGTWRHLRGRGRR